MNYPIKHTFALLLATALFVEELFSQTPPVMLEIETRDGVFYVQDVYDESKWGADPNRVQRLPAPTFTPFNGIADITSVNGKPAKGAVVWRTRVLNLAPNATGTTGIADVTRAAVGDWIFEILQDDMTPIGTIVASGLQGGTPPPGAPVLAPIGNWIPVFSNFAVTGGTGAFLGVRGQAAAGPNIVNGRPASVAESPANRRIHSGGSHRYILHLIPMVQPEVATTLSGPAIFHQDFSPVTSLAPARGGELVIVRARGLGPTRPGVNPGQPFPLEPLQEVSSPVEVTFNGRPGEVVNKIGWPTENDTYRIDVRIPESIPPGMAVVRLTAAFISGPETRVALQ